MAMAYIMLSVESGTDEEVLEDLMRIKGVTEASLVYGIYDIVCKIEVDNMDKLKEAITRIRKLNVRTTQTLIAYKISVPKKID